MATTIIRAPKRVATQANHSARSLNKLWNQFLNSGPLLPKDSWREVDKAATGGTLQERRVTLASACLPGKHFLEVANKSPEDAVTVAAMMLKVEAWRDHLEAMHNLSIAQALRLRLALMEQPDMEGLIEEARATCFKQPETA